LKGEGNNHFISLSTNPSEPTISCLRDFPKTFLAEGVWFLEEGLPIFFLSMEPVEGIMALKEEIAFNLLLFSPLLQVARKNWENL